MLKALKFVHRSEVNDILVYFNLLDEADLAELAEDDQDSATAETIMVRISCRDQYPSAGADLGSFGVAFCIHHMMYSVREKWGQNAPNATPLGICQKKRNEDIIHRPHSFHYPD